MLYYIYVNLGKLVVLLLIIRSGSVERNIPYRRILESRGVYCSAILPNDRLFYVIFDIEGTLILANFNVLFSCLVVDSGILLVCSLAECVSKTDIVEWNSSYAHFAHLNDSMISNRDRIFYYNPISSPRPDVPNSCRVLFRA